MKAEDLARNYWTEITQGVCEHLSYCKCAEEHLVDLINSDRARQAEPAPTPSRLHPADLQRLSRIFEANREVSHIWPTGEIDQRIHEWLSIQLAEASSLGTKEE